MVRAADEQLLQNAFALYRDDKRYIPDLDT